MNRFNTFNLNGKLLCHKDMVKILLVNNDRKTEAIA